MTLSINNKTASETPVIVKPADTASKKDPVIPISLIAESASASISSPSSSLGKVEVVKESPTLWKKIAILMIKVAQRECSPKQVSSFDELIRANRETLNENEGWSATTTFHELAKHGAPLPFVDVLFRNEADNNVQDIVGDTPLMWAIANAKNGMAGEILRKLPSSQVSSLNKQCTDRNTALHLLIAKGYTTRSADGQLLPCTNFDLLKLAVEKGANVNLADKKGNTPLHLAYARRDAKMIQLLLEHGADRNAVNTAGQKPIQLAQMGTDTESYGRARDFFTQIILDCFALGIEEYENSENLKTILKL